MNDMIYPCCLTIAGSDSGGNAGVQADLRAFHAYGLHGCTVFAALTAQNPFGVSAIHAIPADFVAAQLDAVLGVYEIRALKTGMLSDPAAIEAIADRLAAHPDRWGSGRLLGETWEYTAGEAFKVDEEKIKSVVLAFPEFGEESQTAPTNAYLQLAEDNTIRIVPETQGNQLIADPVTEAVKAAVLREEDSVNIADVAGAYAVPQVCSTDQGLLDQQSMLNSFLGTTVTYNMPDGTQKVLDRGILKDWITIEENGFITLDEERIRENCENYAAQTASETDMLRSTRIFHSTNRGQLELSCDTWGRKLDQEAESAQLLSDLLTGTSETREPIYSMNITVDDTFGGSYIEVDLASQHVYCYKDGSLFYDAPCVSGTNSVPSRRTVTGIFEIYMKERNRILRGANQEYASFVDFWMPFYEGYGLHNAPWRGEFGGDIYEYSGSHGCVNLSYGAAETIWDNYAVGTPVIVF